MSIRSIIITVAIAAFFVFGLYVKNLRMENFSLIAEKKTLSNELKRANSEISSIRIQQNKVAEIDKRITQELVNAKNTITQLEHDIADGKRRLRLNAKCAVSTASGLDDATTARLTNSAQRDYFTLRDRIEIITKQLTGLQEYVKDQCIK